MGFEGAHYAFQKVFAREPIYPYVSAWKIPVFAEDRYSYLSRKASQWPSNTTGDSRRFPTPIYHGSYRVQISRVIVYRFSSRGAYSFISWAYGFGARNHSACSNNPPALTADLLRRIPASTIWTAWTLASHATVSRQSCQIQVSKLFEEEGPSPEMLRLG